MGRIAALDRFLPGPQSSGSGSHRGTRGREAPNWLGNPPRRSVWSSQELRSDELGSLVWPSFLLRPLARRKAPAPSPDFAGIGSRPGTVGKLALSRIAQHLLHPSLVFRFVGGAS